ncbi:uncharacterized protein K02A2.6-like [Plutella xylostella]|uniref:uncharacterized protein K02A2.6-like n=1 Tax=Plutella xylostella TaxID=51655 RepID=UPI0020322AB2|nr:uncharacterized protein K02A2.6-like [Plutella xylostella]
MSFLGNISVFDHKSGEWSIFKGRLTQFFKINDVKVANKSAVLITHLSDETYRLLRNLVYPKDIDGLSYDDLVQVLDAHFKPKQCSFADKAKFYGATRNPGESLGEWAARLRGLASFCNFGTALESTLLDRFVLGLGMGPERDRLFEQDSSDLTFAKALEIAERAECAREAKALVTNGAGVVIQQEPVYRVASERGGAPRRPPPRAAPAAAAPGDQRDQHVSRCSVCGLKNHSELKCRFKSFKCQKCGVKGHLRKMCKLRVNNIETEENDSTCEDCKECSLFNMRYENYEPITLPVKINNEQYCMEIDSGSGISVMSHSFYSENFEGNNLNPCSIRMCFYNGHKLTPLGYFCQTVTYNNMSKPIKFYVIENGGPPLLGRDFMAKFGVSLISINNNNIIVNQSDNEIHKFMTAYPGLWSDGLGKFSQFQIKLRLKENSEPKFFKARSVPFAIKDKVDQELERLTDLGILVPTNYSDYATPIVPVLKDNGKVRIAGDYSLTLNKDMYIDKYPMPRIEEVFAKVGGGESYTKIDLSNAYNQFEIEEDSQSLTTINTPRGLFKYTRLVYGLANAPAIFQRTMETLLAGVEGVSCWLDDVCVTGPTREIHLQRLRQVLERLNNAGLKLQKDKCEFFKPSVTYLGYVIDKNGIRTCPKKVAAIMESPAPKCVTEVKRFLGIINYYRNFIPGASTILSPLQNLLRKDAPWTWSDREEQAFQRIKRELASDRVLTHFDPEARLTLCVDASPTGLGAYLAQGEEGHERPLAFASRSLSASERNYSQINKEAAAIIFGVKHFHQYLYGREIPFILKTDHRPLLAIFGKKNGVPVMTASRLQRYAIFLSAYNYDIQYIAGDRNSVADYFSRMPVSDSFVEPEECAGRSLINFIVNETLPISFHDIKKATASDATLKTVIKYLLIGWPKKVKCKNILPYFNCKNDLEIDNGCLMRGHRIIIPQVYRTRMIHELHKGHLGVVKTKSLARTKMWWPGIDGDIQRSVLACSTCSALRPAPPAAPPAPWPRDPAPWTRLHIDYMQFAQRFYLIVVDSHSKWVECLYMCNLSTKSLIQRLKLLFNTFGIPHVIVSDNDPKISNEEFTYFCLSNGIKHITSPIYHPCSNGQAENSVKTCKKMLKCIFETNMNASLEQVNEKLSSYLFEFRNSVHCSTGESPAKLMFGRELRGKLDLIMPPQKQTIVPNIDKADCRQFDIGQKVLARYFVSGKPNWTLGKIINKLGSRMYVVEINDIECRRHADQLRLYHEPIASSECLVPSASAPQVQPRNDTSLSPASVNPEMALETSGPPTAPPNLDNEPSVDEFHECDSEVVAGPSLESPATPAGAPVAVRGEDARPPHSQLTTAVTDNVTAESQSAATAAPHGPYNLRPRNKVITYK